MVVIVCIDSSSKSWEPYQPPSPWHSRAGWRSRPQHQKRTLRAHLGASETIVVFSSTGAAGGAEIPLVSSKDALGGNYKLVRACQRPYNVCLYLIRNSLSVRS